MTFSAFASIILDRSINKPLDYGIPDQMLNFIRPGIRVSVPIKGKPNKGTILSLKKTSDIPGIQPILEVLSDNDVLSNDLFELADWISKYYATPLTRALSCILPASIRKDMKEKQQLLIKRNISQPKLIEYTSEIRQKSPKQAQVLDIILQHPQGILLTELLTYEFITKAPIETLIKQEILLKEPVIIDRSILEEEEFLQTRPKTLSSEQAEALAKITGDLEQNCFKTHLLHGVTGSGKTEVYLQAIDRALALDKGVIMLVPEIALTMQTIERLKARFQRRIAILHHRLSDGERFDTWHAIRKKEISIVVGARSAIFSPLPNLGLIIVDEEQEHSYKQIDEMPCYHARDIAIVRAKLTNATVVLGSATPSLETFYNASTGKYTLSTLSERAGGASPPTTKIVDMKVELDRAKGFTLFSEPLLEGIKKRIATGEQVILFLNRRGYFASQTCSSCHKPIFCNHCDIALTYHRSENLLSCHLCGFTLKPPLPKCPYCGETESLKFKGPGTEQVERSLHAIFPEIRTIRMDRDTTKHKGSHDRLFKQFRSGKADLLIGTQMIAKGLHFPSVTLVGVLTADSTLHIPDFRASEYLFQLISQVSGRSGRGQLPGEVIVQTFLEDHPLIKLAAKEDYHNFYQSEIEERRAFDYPPFTRLAKVLFSGRDPEKTLAFATRYHAALKRILPSTYTLFEPTPCGHAKIKDRHRFHLLIKGSNMLALSRALLTLPRPPASISLLIDIDPTSTFS